MKKKTSILILTSLFLFVFSFPVFAETERSIERDVKKVRTEVHDLVKEIVGMVSEKIKDISSQEVPVNFRFNEDLKKGLKGDSVLYLQKILNTDEETKLKENEQSAKEVEEGVFGEETEDAVKRFQEKYKSETLSPVGLTKATGYVGSLSRKKLNNMLGTVSVEIISESDKKEVEEKMLKILSDIKNLRERVFDFYLEASTKVPINITGEVIANGEVRLYWSGNKDTDYYVGYKATKSGGPYTEVGITEDTTGKVTELENGETYYFVITQVIDDKESDFSEEVSVKMPEFEAPYNITSYVVNVGQLGIRWRTKENPEKFNIYRATKYDGPYTFLGETTMQDFVDRSVNLYTDYYYVITQFINGRESDYSPKHADSWYYNFQEGVYPYVPKSEL